MPEIFSQPNGRLDGCLVDDLSAAILFTEGAHNLENQTEPHGVGLQFAIESLEVAVFGLLPCLAVLNIFPFAQHLLCFLAELQNMWTDVTILVIL